MDWSIKIRQKRNNLCACNLQKVTSDTCVKSNLMLKVLRRSVYLKYKHIALYVMDVLEPELIWVQGRCYRFYESTAWKNIQMSAPYMEDKESVCSNEESETDLEIVAHDTSFKHTFHVPKIFYSHIIGTKGVTRRKLENETRTTIDIPKKGKDGNIVITGRERKDVISARHRIDLLVEASKKKMGFTHFLSIPLNKKEIIDKYISFKNDVLEKYDKPTYNIDESLFQTPSKLHLTIGMLKLFDDDDKKNAIDALTNCKENIIDPFVKETGPLNIHLEGVECMNDDPTEVKVLFAQIARNEKLQELVNTIAEYFVDIGLMTKEYENVKLHATLMNTSFKNDYPAKFRDKYDASEIIKAYSKTLFGETIFNQIDISELHTATKDSYYKSIVRLILKRTKHVQDTNVSTEYSRIEINVSNLSFITVTNFRKAHVHKNSGNLLISYIRREVVKLNHCINEDVCENQIHVKSIDINGDIASLTRNLEKKSRRKRGVTKMDIVRRLIILCVLIAILPFVLIIAPLYLRHKFYADVAYAVTDSDIIEINDGISTIFCSEHTLKMNGTFNAFQMSHRPEITSKRKHIRLKKSMNLPDDTFEYWGFYLLKNATVALSVCSRFEGASIFVVKGDKNLRTCDLLEHNINKQMQDIFAPDANRQVKITYQSNAQEIDSEETTTIEPITTVHNIDKMDELVMQINSENSLEKNVEKNPVNNTSSIFQTTDEKSMKSLETLYHTATSYISKYIDGLQENVNNTRKGRNIKRRKMKKNKNERMKQRKKSVYNYDKKMHLEKLKQTLHSDRIKERKKQKTNEKEIYSIDEIEIYTKRFKRSREFIMSPSLLDQGIRHGGNADKNYTSDSSEMSSISSFENSLLNCYNGDILLVHEFKPSTQCTNISYLLNGKHIQANHHVEQDGYYYYIFYSDNDIVSNDIYTIFDIYKPTFQYENVTKSCINQTECSFHIKPLSADRVIVEIPTKDGIDHNEMDDVDMLISICQPRMGAYMIFPIATLLLILGCAFI